MSNTYTDTLSVGMFKMPTPNSTPLPRARTIEEFESDLAAADQAEREANRIAKIAEAEFDKLEVEWWARECTRSAAERRLKTARARLNNGFTYLE